MNYFMQKYLYCFNVTATTLLLLAIAQLILLTFFSNIVPICNVESVSLYEWLLACCVLGIILSAYTILYKNVCAMHNNFYLIAFLLISLFNFMWISILGIFFVVKLYTGTNTNHVKNMIICIFLIANTLKILGMTYYIFKGRRCTKCTVERYDYTVL